jgi:hypothetical protein
MPDEPIPPQAVPHPDTGEPVAVRVAACGARDRGEQALLFNRCFTKRVDAAALTWRYDDNPHGQAVSLVSRPEGLPVSQLRPEGWGTRDRTAA